MTWDDFPPHRREEMQGIKAAMRRAALQAREVARRTNTHLVYYINDQMVFMTPDEVDEYERANPEQE